MDETQSELIKAWLLKAQHDLVAIRKLSEGPEAYLDTAIYHCQQVAEKAIKGFLVYRDQRFEKTHDLRILLELALPYESGFSSLKDAAVLLTPYATEFRYPAILSSLHARSLKKRWKQPKKFWSLCSRFCLRKRTPKRALFRLLLPS